MTLGYERGTEKRGRSGWTGGWDSWLRRKGMVVWMLIEFPLSRQGTLRPVLKKEGPWPRPMIPQWLYHTYPWAILTKSKRTHHIYQFSTYDVPLIWVVKGLSHLSLAEMAFPGSPPYVRRSPMHAKNTLHSPRYTQLLTATLSLSSGCLGSLLTHLHWSPTICWPSS